ncbi:ankyrin [Imleria badia]|nr:ankyrin [Imleria badia]
MLEQRPPFVNEADIVFIIRKLVQVGVDHTEHDSTQRTALYFAILGGYQVIVVYLLLIGTPFPPDFISVVSRIASVERIPMLRLIVEAGADIHAHVGGDNTTLHLAINFFRDDCLDAVKILVDAGCNPFIRNAAGKTPLHLALDKENLSVADYLLSQGTPPSDALLAIVESKCPITWRLEALRALVNGGVDIHGIATQYEDALIMSLDPERRQGLEMAILPGAKYGPSGRNTSDESPVGLLRDRTSSITDYLLPTGRSPPPNVLFAILRSDLPTAWKALIICSLVGKGADVRGILADGSTLLNDTLLALDERQGLDLVKLLIGAGCDPSRCTGDHKLSLRVALDRNFPLIAEHLLSIQDSLPPDALFTILHSTFPVA